MHRPVTNNHRVAGTYHVSTLLLAIVARAGVHLPSLIASMELAAGNADSSRPTSSPIANLGAEGSMARMAGIAYATRQPFADVVRDFDFYRRHRRGAALRPPSDPLGALGVRLRGRTVALETHVGGGMRLLIVGRLAMLDLGVRAAADAEASLAGRPVGTLVEDELLCGGGWTVGHSSIVARPASASASMVTFRTEVIPVRSEAAA